MTQYPMVGGELEIVGGDEIVGYDYSEMFGADVSPGQLAQVAQARAAGGAVIRQTKPSTLREQVLPFYRSYVLSETASITSYPQRLFRPERLTFASLTAQYFLINSVSIAQEPQFVADGGALAQMYTEVAVGMRLKGKTANLGAQIVVNATNLDAANTRILYGQFVGPAALT
jgi:hypothetical protein